MLDDQDIEIINDLILDNLEVMQIKDEFYDNDYEYGNLPLELPIEHYEQTDDPEFIDDRACSFIEPITGKELGYWVTVSNYNRRYAIKKLDKAIFYTIANQVDLDQINEFSIVKTNILDEIDKDLFQPIKSGLKRISIYESYLPNIPIGLFRNLNLHSLEIDFSTIRKSFPDLGLSGVTGIAKTFIFSKNILGNINEIKINQILKKLNVEKVIVDI